MKKKFGSPLIAFVFIFVLSLSCTDNEDAGINAPTGKIIMIYDRDDDFLFEAVGTAFISDDEIMIRGQDAGDSLSILIREQHGEGSYDIMASYPVTSQVDVRYATSEGSTLYSSVQCCEAIKVGSVDVTEIDEINKTISGRFNSLLYGKFPMKYSGSFTRIPY